MAPKCNLPVSVQHASPARLVCSRRLDFHLKACALAALCGFWMEARSSALTLLSSAEVSTVPVPLAPSSLPPAPFSAGSGRIGPTTQPLGSASIAAQPVPPPPKPAAAETVEQGSHARRAPHRPGKVEPAPAEKPKHHHAVEEEAVSTPAPHERHAPIVHAPDFKTTEDYKSTPVLATTAVSPLNVEFGMAWYNKYYFRGVRILDVISSEKTRHGVVNADIVVGYAREHDAFTVGVNYFQALARQEPKGAEFQVPPNSFNRSGKTFDLPSRDRYEEYNLNLAYTHDLPHDFRGTVEYNRYVFSNGGFYQAGGSGPIRYANETVLKLDYLGVKNLTPSLSWAHDFDGFRGDFFEARVDGKYALPDLGGVAVEFKPYMSLSYDMSYNGSNNGWNSFEFGATVPFHLNSFLTLNLTANYVKELSRSGNDPRATDGFWGGASFTIDWGGPVQPVAAASDKKVVLAPQADPGLWEVSLGASYRMFQYDFDHRSLRGFDLARVFTPPVTFPGAVRFAGDNNVPVFYGTGRILGQSATPQQAAAGFGPAASGVRQALIRDASFQYVGTFGRNAYVNFSTDTTTFKNTTQTRSGHRQDEDSNVSPYLNVDRELWRSGGLSVRAGLAYDFAESSSDSGYHLDRLDTITQITSRSGFDYAIDNFGYLAGTSPQPSTAPLVVVNAAKYADSLLAAGFITPATAAYLRTQTPGRDLAIIKQDVAAVGSFVRSSFDLDIHELSLPISIRQDLGHRLHVELTVAPTLTVADAELSTDVQQRSLTGIELGNPRTTTPIKFTPPSGVIGGPPAGGFPGGAGFNFFSGFVKKPVNAPFASAPPVPALAASPSGGGKAATPARPDLPGRLVGHSQESHSGLNALFGVSTTTKVIFDLNQEGTFYAELWGRYHYIENLHLGNSFGNGDIDLSGFQAGIGLGYRF